LDEDMTATLNTNKAQQSDSRIRWQGMIESVQCRAWVWRYKTENRTHHHLGFNLFLKGEADGWEGRFIVAVSENQYIKLQFRIGDVFQGTAWPCVGAEHDIADYYRAGGLKAITRVCEQTDPVGPPFTGLLPGIEVYLRRGARMLHAKLLGQQCFTCMWANKSAVEIEYKFGKGKRYRKETFCYGPRSCPFYDMGPPRQVPYFDSFPSLDDGWMDDICTEQRGDDD
jgi:hypothetical protein